MLEIDGSQGEGGGQVLRTSVALSALAGRPFRISRIRANRPNPGLAAQHLTAVRAVAQACGGRVSGDFLGSASLEFHPANIASGNFSFDCGTAGSTALVLQSLLPAMFFSQGDCRASLRGGTENKWAPTGLFLRGCFVPAMRRLGFGVDCTLEKFGFYPAGGGLLEASTSPCAGVKCFSAVSRGKLLRVRGISLVSSSLPMSVAERQKARALRQLCELSVSDAKIDLLQVDCESPGSEIFISAEFENCSAGFSALGERGKPAEKVAGEAMFAFKQFLSTNACVETHVSDQLLPYAALASGRSEFTVPEISSHFETNATVIMSFLPRAQISWEKRENSFIVRVDGAGFSRPQK